MNKGTPDHAKCIPESHCQMIIISPWMVVLLLLAACSVKCHWRRQNSRDLDDTEFVERSQASPPEPTLLKNAAPRGGSCPSPNICIPTISCPDVLHLLEKAVKEPNLREQTIALVRRRFLCSIIAQPNLR